MRPVYGRGRPHACLLGSLPRAGQQAAGGAGQALGRELGSGGGRRSGRLQERPADSRGSLEPG